MQFKRLKIHNFVSIRDMELEFEKDTAYHFVGGNDSGKSNILDAMRILCFNIPNIHVKMYISDYADSFTLEGEDFEGNIVSLTRGAESVYKLKRADGSEEVWENINNEVPREIAEVVNMYKDTTKNVMFNFRYADDKILFMNTTSGENYSYFQKALGTDEINKHLKKANSMENVLDGEIHTIFSKILYERDKLKQNPDLSYAKEYLEEIKGSLDKEIEKLTLVDNIFQLENKIEKINNIDVPIEIIEYDSSIYQEEITKINTMDSILKGIERIACLDNKIRRVEEITGEIDRLQTEKLKVKSLVSVRENLSKLGKTTKKVEKLKIIIEEDIELKINKDKTYELLNKVNILNKVIKTHKQVTTIEKKINKNKECLVAYGKVEKEQEVFESISKLKERLDSYRDTIQGIDHKKKEIKNKDKQMVDFMVKNNFCPVVFQREDNKCPFKVK